MLINIYKQLLKAYGKQGWWPLSKNQLQTKHHQGNPKNLKDQFEIIVGAILTQNTSWTNVEKAIYNLNKSNLLNLNKIIKAKKSKIAKLIRPAGYYNQKAERLKIIAEKIKNNSNLLKEREELLKTKGIGPETADSIILYAAEKPSFVIDTYTKRIFSRLGLINSNNYNEIKEFFEKNIKKDTETYKEYHALIVEHAKRHCKNKPECNNCFLKERCNFASGKV